MTEDLIKQSAYLAICIYFEARGESMAGKVAVAHVILNRVRQKDKSVKDVVFQPWQFSWANFGKRPAIDDYEAFIECQIAAIKCFEERLSGKDLFGADHYYNPSLANPDWAREKRQVALIGNHRFMR